MTHLLDTILGTEPHISSAALEAFEAIFGQPLLEANAGDEVKRAVKILCNQYGVQSHEEARQICLDLRHVVFDIFATGGHADASRDQNVVKVLGMFEPVLRLLCDNMGIAQNDNGALDRMSSFGKHFKPFVQQNGERLNVKVTVTNPKTMQRIKTLEIDGRPVSLEDIMSTPVVSESHLDNTPAQRRQYRIEHIPSHDDAVREYQGVVPWCLTWDDSKYWNKYSNGGANKCYFVFRDDFDSVEETTGYNDPRDEYGLTAIGIFIAPDGTVAHLFNRHNRVDHIYSDKDMERLVGKPFEEAFPPYTEEEIEESRERCGEGRIDPVTCDNFFEQCTRIAEYQMEHDEWEGMYDVVNNLSERTMNVGYNDHTGNEVNVAIIRDSSDNKLYATVMLYDTNVYQTSDMLYPYCDWIPVESALDITTIGRGNGRMPDKYGAVVVIGNQIIAIVDNWAAYVWNMPDGYSPAQEPSLIDHLILSEDVDDSDHSYHRNDLAYPVAIFVHPEGSAMSNILVLPNSRIGDPFLLLPDDCTITADDDTKSVKYALMDDSDMFNDPANGGVMHDMPDAVIREIWQRGSIDEVEEDDDE